MNKKYVVPFALLLLIACQHPKLRQDPFPATLTTGNHSLLVDFCGSVGTTVGCSLASEEPVVGKLLRLYTPATGTLKVYGCGIDTSLEVSSLSQYAFRFTELLPIGKPGGCIVDLLMIYRIPSDWKTNGVPIQNIRSRLFIERREASSSAAAFSLPGHQLETGLGTWKVREGVVFPPGSGQSSLLVSLPSRDSGSWQISGCGMKLTGEFDGDSIEVDLAELWPGRIPLLGECLLFGWAVGREGTDVTFSIGLTVYRRDDAELGGQVWREKDRVCYQAQPTVSFATWGEQRSNELKTCFKYKAPGILTFVTAQGRAAYAQVGEDGVQWIR